MKVKMTIRILIGNKIGNGWPTKVTMPKLALCRIGTHEKKQFPGKTLISTVSFCYRIGCLKLNDNKAIRLVFSHYFPIKVLTNGTRFFRRCKNLVLNILTLVEIIYSNKFNLITLL